MKVSWCRDAPMIRDETPRRDLEDWSEDDAGEVLLLRAEMIVRRGRPQAAEEDLPPTLAYATAPAVRPWRGLSMAGGLHLLILGLLLAVIKLHMPAPPPDGPVISVVMESTPQGDTTQAVTQPSPAPPPPAPPRTRPALVPKPMQTPQPVAAPVAAKAVLPLPVPPAPKPPPSLPQKLALPPALAQGTQIPSHKIGMMVVAVDHPALADSGNTVPVYSALARSLGEHGRVDLSVLVLADGLPGRVSIVKSSGYSTLDDSARDAVLTWHFQPATKDGLPVASVVSYWFQFELQ
jgi:protein TonB